MPDIDFQPVASGAIDFQPLEQTHAQVGFQSVSPSSSTPETDKSLFQEAIALAKTPSPQWLQGFEGAVTELAKSVPGMIAQFPQMAYTGYELAQGDHVKAAGDILKQAIPMGEQIARDIQQPVGTKEWWRSALQMGMMAAPVLDLLRPTEVPIGNRPEPYVPPPTPPIQRPGTIAADVSQAMRGPGWERRFTLVPEPKPILEPAPDLETVLSQLPIGKFGKETPEGFIPQARTGVVPPSETARIGEPNAIQPSDAQVQAGATPLREQARPESEVPKPSDSDNVVGETQGTARELPREESKPTVQSVAAETPPTDEPSVVAKTYDEAQSRIDQIETSLEKQNHDLNKLYNPDWPTGETPETLSKWGYTKMPPDLVEAYRQRDAIGNVEYSQHLKDLRSVVKSTGLSDTEVREILDHFGIKGDKADAMAHYFATEHGSHFASLPVDEQAEKIAYTLAAHRGEMFDELKDISPQTLRDAANVVKVTQEYIKGKPSGKFLPVSTGGEPSTVSTLPEPKESVAVSEPVSSPVGGVHAEALSERPIEAPEGGDVVGWEDATDLGNKWLDKGGDPNKIIAHFQKTGQISTPNMGRMRAAMLRIQAATNVAGDALRDNPNDPKVKAAYDQAVANEQRFANAYKPMHTVASNTLKSLQGREPLTPEMAQSYTGLERDFTKVQGRRFTPDEAKKASDISRRSKTENEAYVKANQDMFKTMDKEFGRIRAPKVNTIQDLGSLFGEAMKEVCDV